MSIPMNRKPINPADNSVHHPLALLSRDQLKAMAALILMGTAVFFFLAYSGHASWTSPWWVMYIAIPSAVLIYAAGASFFQAGKITGFSITDAVIGVLGLVISYIMYTDPTWSFTRNTELDRLFPILRQVDWDPVWQWMLVGLGAVALFLAIYKRVVGVGVLGSILVIVGVTFILELRWDYVWPVLLFALGAGLLLQQKMRK